MANISKCTRSKSFKFVCVYENWIGLNRFGQIQKQVLSSCLSLFKMNRKELLSIFSTMIFLWIRIYTSHLVCCCSKSVCVSSYASLIEWMNKWNEWMNMILSLKNKASNHIDELATYMKYLLFKIFPFFINIRIS